MIFTMLKTLKSILPIHPLFFFSPIFTNSYELHGFSLQNYTQKVKVKKVKRRELKVLGNYEILYRNHYLLIKRREEKRRCSRWLRMAIFPLSSGVQKLGVKDCRKAIQRCPVCTAAYLFFFSQKKGVWFNFILSMKGGLAFCCSNVYLVMHIYTYFEQR